jgi:hypothetical protein
MYFLIGKRWQDWAHEEIRKRLGIKETYEYNVDDFAVQRIQREVAHKSGKSEFTFTDFPSNIDEGGAHLQSTSVTGNDHAGNDANTDFLVNNSLAETPTQGLWEAVGDHMVQQDVFDVRSVILAFYSALEFKNAIDIRTLWLPSDTSEITLPGFDREHGSFDLERLISFMHGSCSKFGKITADIKSISIYGYVAYVHTLEIIGTESVLERVAARQGKDRNGWYSNYRAEDQTKKKVCSS